MTDVHELFMNVHELFMNIHQVMNFISLGKSSFYYSRHFSDKYHI